VELICSTSASMPTASVNSPSAPGESKSSRVLSSVEQGVEQCRAAHAVLAGLGQPGHEHRGERPAHAQRRDVHLGAAGDVLDDVKGGAWVVVQTHIRHRRVRVAVADGEHGVPVLHRPLDEAAARRQVEDVVHVDPRRADQQRHRVDGVGLRRVLDQLHQRVAVDDTYRGGGEVLAEAEAAAVDLARPAAVALEVVDEVLGPVDDALPLRLDGPPLRLGVSLEEVRRGAGVDDRLRREACPLPGASLEPTATSTSSSII
jgi:hypothetical protein